VSTEKPVGDIKQEMERLSSAVCKLESCFTDIVITVKSATTMDTKKVDDTQIKPPPLTSSTELGENINVVTQRILVLANNLTELDKRIEL
jgi:hypothetical protein